MFARADGARCTRGRLRLMVGKGCDEELIVYQDIAGCASYEHGGRQW